MKATVARVDVTYEVIFKRPLLDRAGSSPPFFQSLYDRLSDNFPISLADVAVHTDPHLSNVFASINLFGGAASVELRLDRWRATFRILRTDEDRKIVIRCLNLVRSVMEDLSDRVEPTRSIVTVASWYICDGGAGGVAEIMTRHGSLGTPIDQSFLGAEQVVFNINPHLRNATEGWDATFLVQPSLVEGAHLFASYTGTYIEGGRYSTIDQKAEHIKFMLSGMLEKIGVEVTA